MTYILGMKRYGVTSIIADLRATDKVTRIGQNTALKSGILFPGVIFGVSGDAAAAMEFLFRARKAAEFAGPHLTDKWNAFRELAQQHVTGGRNINVLVASRASGKSELFLYDSKQRSLEAAPHLIGLGSGDVVLARYVTEIDSLLDAHLSIGNEGDNCSAHIRPGYFCVCLTETVTGLERDLMERKGVGGIFHYVYQTDHSDEYQPTTVYVNCYANHDGTAFGFARYRVGYVDRALVLEFPPGIASKDLSRQEVESLPGVSELIRQMESLPRYHVFLHGDDVADSDKNKRKLEERFKRMVKQFEELDFYQFCGVGFARSTDRHVCMGHERRARDDVFVVDRDTGAMSPTWTNEISRQLRKCQRFPDEDHRTQYLCNTTLQSYFSELQYNCLRIIDCAKSPDECSPPEGRKASLRIRWFADDTAILAACVQGDSSKEGLQVKIEFAVPIACNLPRGTIDRNMPLQEVLDIFSRSFCIPISAHRNHKRQLIYSGPTENRPPTMDDFSEEAAVIVAISDLRENSMHTLFAFNVQKHLEWFREKVAPTLSLDARHAQSHPDIYTVQLK